MTHQNCDTQSHHDHTHHHTHDDPQKFLDKVEFLDSHLRKTLLPPEELLALLSLDRSSVVLDAGSGTGFLTIPAARQTSSAVYALDLDARMLEVIKTKAADEGLTNIKLMQENIGAIPLPDGSVDVAVASLILHEVDSLATVLAELRRVLRSGGRFLCVDYEKEESSVKGPPMHIRIPSTEMKQTLEASGFVVTQCLVPSESVYIIVAEAVEQPE